MIRRRLIAASWLALWMGALTPACGARSQLRGAQPCPEEGVVQRCIGICGEGTTECLGGFWTQCDIPPRDESCEDVCGVGTRHCEDEVWSECVVQPVEETCENDCGSGFMTCVDRTWSDCQVEIVVEECTKGCGPGTRTCESGSWAACDAPDPLPPELTATIRDFSDSHPDFELPTEGGVDRGIVADELGADGKPVYQGGSGTLTTSGRENFDQWYRDVPGVNESTTIELPLETSSFSDEFYIYENRAFFPIDNRLLGNEGREHNYHFTLEVEATFVYQEGQVFAFDGDDDIWVFINNRLVIDIGGLHESLSESVELDRIADDIGIVPGNEYPLKIFFAERHTVASNFVIQTSIADLGECPE